MHKPIIALMVTACLGAAPAAHAAYLIKLKNGNEFVTSRYWQDGKQILFETYDGTFGVAKGFVTRVEKTDKPVRLITTAQAAEEVKPIETTNKGEAEAKKPVDNQEPAAALKKEDDPLFRHFQSLKERGERLASLPAAELNQLAKDLGDLKRAMQLGGKTNDLLDEFTELHDIANRVEDAIKSRR